MIDCTTVPEGMMESELFGHVRGAFTGAVSDKPGLIELANGGTVFFDEIGELPLLLQSKLLRVLEENEVRPVGGTRVRRVDMRFIAATNRNLEARVRDGSFRKDLYYRLAVVQIAVPPLRERREDIRMIARHLLGKLSREFDRAGSHFDEDALNVLMAYAWPGNGRELRNVIERAVMLATGDTITAQDLRALLPKRTDEPETFQTTRSPRSPIWMGRERAIEQFYQSLSASKADPIRGRHHESRRKQRHSEATFLSPDEALPGKLDSGRIRFCLFFVTFLETHSSLCPSRYRPVAAR